MSQGALHQKELGSYILEKRIALGGMAEIYLAKTQGVAGFEKYLCLKVLHPDLADDEEFIEMLIDEAKLVVGLNHVNICQIFDLGRHEDTYYIAMEYVDGADLFKVMRALSEQDRDVPIDVAAYVAQEICTGLDYAHRKKDTSGQPLGIIHRDISPQNILVSQWGEVKIIDFGIAKAASRSKKTQAGVIKGKYYYMSPEQAWGENVDHRSDIFSAGIILYEVLTGQMLYLEEDVSVLMDMVRRAEIPPPTTRRPDIPPQLENVVMKALAKRPEDRWQSANEFQVALTSFLYSFSPDYTPERLAQTLKQALDGEAEPEEEEEEEEEEYEEIDDLDLIVHVEEEQLMSRVDYAPRSEHSVIFNINDIAPDGFSDDDEDDDGGEKTTVSAMPHMMDMMRQGAADGARGGQDSQAWDEDGPTQVAGRQLDAQPAHRQDISDMDMAAHPAGGRPHRESRESAPREIVVGQTAPVNLPPREAPPNSISGNTQENANPTPGRQQHIPTTPPAAQGHLATPHTPTGPGMPHQGGPWTPAPVLPQDPGGVPAAAPHLDPNPAYTGGAQAPTTPPAGAAPPAAELDPWEQARQRAHQQLSNTSQAAYAPTQQTAPPPAAVQPQPNYPSQVPAMGQSPGPAGPFDATVHEPPGMALDMQPAGGGRGWQVALAVLAVLVVLGAVGAGMFLFTRPPAAEGGFIEIVSVPEGASARFSGQALDLRTPVTVPVKDLLAKHKVEVELPGYQPWQELITFPQGYSRLRVLAVLSPVYGKVMVRSRPSGATIYIKGESFGRTPATVENLSTQEDLSVEVRLTGYAPASRTVRWEEQSSLEVEIPLVKQK